LTISGLRLGFNRQTSLVPRRTAGSPSRSDRHLNDVERVFSYRLLRVSRNDATPLPGFEQEDYVRAAGFDSHALQDLLQEFEHLRHANILAINNMSPEAVLHRGTASGYIVSARAVIYMLVGHVEHHMASLHEKYLLTKIISSNLCRYRPQLTYLIGSHATKF
jgi:hypothetical protein